MLLKCPIAMACLDNNAVTVSDSNGLPGQQCCYGERSNGVTGKCNTTMFQVKLNCMDNIMPLCVRQKWMAWII
jgi:hypothetical protein